MLRLSKTALLICTLLTIVIILSSTVISIAVIDKYTNTVPRVTVSAHDGGAELMPNDNVFVFRSYDKRYADVARITQSTMSRYCDSMGYSYMEYEREPESGMKPHWLRYSILRELLTHSDGHHKYQYFAYIDTDAVPLRNRRLPKPHKSEIIFGNEVDRHYVTRGPINSGIIIIPRSQVVNDFLDIALTTVDDSWFSKVCSRRKHIKGRFYDQDCIDALILATAVDNSPLNISLTFANVQTNDIKKIGSTFWIYHTCGYSSENQKKRLTKATSA